MIEKMNVATELRKNILTIIATNKPIKAALMYEPKLFKFFLVNVPKIAMEPNTAADERNAVPIYAWV